MDLELGEKESAIIFDADGVPRLVLPEQDENDEALTSTFQVLRCATLFRMPDVLDAVDENIKQSMGIE